MSKFNLFVTYLVLPFYWIRSQWLRRFGSQSQINKEMKRYARHYLGFRRIKIVNHFYENLPDSPLIFISNHQSHNDIFITLGSINRPFRFVAKKELFTNFVTGTFMKMSQSYPLDRDNPRQSLSILKQAINDVEQGANILVFPEGTRSFQKEMLPFKEGLFSMIRKANAPLVPMYIKESYNEHQQAFHVYYGKLILPEVYQLMKGNELSQYVLNQMQELKHQAYLPIKDVAET